MNLGYACINTTLSRMKPKITTNRGMIKRTFLERGLPYASELALENAKDLMKILQWNNENGIKAFRVSSDIIPWGTEYDFKSLPDYQRIKEQLQRCGMYATNNGIRLTTHPGPYVVLTSPKENVVSNAIADLEVHGKIFDLLNLSRSPYNKINIHCNGVYGDKQSAMDRFCHNFERLSDRVQSRLTVENDDKTSMYSILDLMYIHKRTGIPIVFDYHHHIFNDGGMSEREALELALSTWPKGIKPIVHYSESKSIHESNGGLKPQAHSDLIYKLPDTYGYDVDIMVEAKLKELAILPFL